MAINATNYDGTKDYKIAEIGDVYHPNLLINGDFQVNQRGQTTYTGTSSGVYTVDMWKLTNGTLTKPSNGVGVTVTAGSAACTLVQKIPNKYGQTRHTLHTKCASAEYTTTVQDNSTNTVQIANSVGSISLKVDTNYITVTYNVKPNKSVHIEYCDVFMSSTYSEHTIEDYGVAYQRCLRFLNILKGASMAIATGYVNSGHQVISVLQFATRMENAPTVSLSGTLELTTETGGGAVINTLSPSQITRDRCLLTMRPDFDYVQGFSVVVLTNNINKTSFITITCEPL